MTFALTPCRVPGCPLRHGVVRFVDPRRATRSDDRDRLGAGIGRQIESPDDSQPVGASAPERQSLPSGLSITG